MGKPTPPPTASGDAVSLHTQPGDRYYDNDAPELPHLDQADDLPPLYDEAAEASNSASAPLLPTEGRARHSLPNLAPGPVSIPAFRTDETIAYYLSSRLDTDADYLEENVRRWAAIPPRPHVRIRGTHREKRRGHNGKDENKDITDFDVSVELTPYLLPNGRVERGIRTLMTAEDSEKVRRGGVCRRRASRRPEGGSVELGLRGKPTLTEWCHMYCANHSGLKTFQLKRRFAGFDQDRVKQHLENMVRRTNYKGNIYITFPLRDEKVEVWSQCRTNRWRLTHSVYVVFCLSFLWILTWPYLFLRTKKFETVSSVWWYSRSDEEGRKRYATLSEDQWYNLWGRAIAKAVLAKRQGTLDQQDLLAADGAPPAFNMDNPAAESAFDLVSAGVNAMNEVNRQLGWGGHEC